MRARGRHRHGKRMSNHVESGDRRARATSRMTRLLAATVSPPEGLRLFSGAGMAVLSVIRDNARGSECILSVREIARLAGVSEGSACGGRSASDPPFARVDHQRLRQTMGEPWSVGLIVRALPHSRTLSRAPLALPPVGGVADHPDRHGSRVLPARKRGAGT